MITMMAGAPAPAAVVLGLDPRAALAEAYDHHRLSEYALAGRSRPYFGGAASAASAAAHEGPGTAGSTADGEAAAPKRKRRRKTGPVVENTPGMCDWMVAAHAEWQRSGGAGSWLSGSSSAADGGQQAPTQQPSSATTASSGGSGGDGSSSTERQWSLIRWAEFVQQLEQHASSCDGGAAAAGVQVASAGEALSSGGCAEWSVEPAMLFNRLVAHHPDRDGRLHALGRRWALPPRSRFVMADVRRWASILLNELADDADTGLVADSAAVEPRLDLWLRLPSVDGGDVATRRGGYRVITLDPPWANKSADRGKRYPTTAWELLPELPLAQLADSTAGCLVAVWVTNKQSYWEWLVNTVFPSWGAEYVTTWYWLKVCDDGTPVLPLDKHRERKPFEPLVIAVIPPSTAAPARSKGAGAARPPPDMSGSIGDEAERSYWSAPWSVDSAAGGVQRIPLKQVFCSVPMAHSAKPPLDSLLDGCFRQTVATELADTASGSDLPKAEETLEMFARGVRPGWTCCGNEALAQQELPSGDGGGGGGGGGMFAPMGPP